MNARARCDGLIPMTRAEALARVKGRADVKAIHCRGCSSWHVVRRSS